MNYGGVGAGRTEFSRSILSILSKRSCILGVVVVGVLARAGEIEISRDDDEICGCIVTLGEDCACDGE
mgnify:FL=1